MCGICGAVAFSGRPSDEETLGRMLASIAHRGPDDEGRFIDETIALGARRLAILDIDGGSQPARSEDGNIVVVFNGEIYNFVELADQLRMRGHVLKSTGDTEVLGHLYEEFGDGFLAHLRGMFAIALWDAKRRRLLLARDRLGLKPLYHAIGSGSVVFGSEIKALLEHPAVTARVNLEALGSFLTLRYVPAPDTMFAGIQLLEPGHYMVVSDAGVKIVQYWDLSFAEPATGAEHELVEELERLLTESVRLHLRSDVEVGAFLSGGLDSSTVVALASAVAGNRIRTYAVGFEGADADVSELPFARMVAEHLDTDHHEIILTAKDLVDHISDVAWYEDQPIADEAALASLVLARTAARDVKVVLTGEGGDELLAGYARYQGERFAPFARWVPRPFFHLALRATRDRPDLQRPRIALSALSERDDIARLVAWFPLLNTELREALIAPSKRSVLRGRAAAAFSAALHGSDARDRLSQMLYVDTKLWLPDDLLARTDKTTMAASLEARVPLLDHKVVEFCASLPSSLKIHGRRGKYLLSTMSRRLLPEAVIDRPKRGFPLPTGNWLRGPAHQLVREHLSPSRIRARGLFDPDGVSRIVRAHQTNRANYGSVLWALISLELWYCQYIDGARR